MKVEKAVITAAGLGTRLLPMSKELPKEMLPIYVRGASGGLILKPLLQALFEQLHYFGIREFCFVLGEVSARLNSNSALSLGIQLLPTLSPLLVFQA